VTRSRLSFKGRIAHVIDETRGVSQLPVVTTATIGATAIAAFAIFFPSAIGWALSLTLGISSWSVGVVFSTWHTFLQFVLAVLLATVALVGVSATRSWLDVRWITGGEQPWNIGPNHAKDLRKDTIAVAGAILFELILPIFLILVLLLLFFSLTTLLLPDSLNTVRGDMTNIGGALSEGLKIDTSSIDALVSAIRTHLREITSTLRDTLAKSAAVVGGAVSAGASLLVFLFKRRQSNLATARVIATELTAIIKYTVETTPIGLSDKDSLVNLPEGRRVIVSGAIDRDLLLLDSTMAVKLPTCLLKIVVRFFHADLAFSQVYAAIGSEAFAQANAERRRRYLDQYERAWLEEYQPAAFSALFRLYLYARLRAWSI
jgi:hypothetical protein